MFKFFRRKNLLLSQLNQNVVKTIAQPYISSRKIYTKSFIFFGATFFIASSIYFIQRFRYSPLSIEEITVNTTSASPIINSRQKLNILTWNIQFMAGNKNNHFFYDGGNDPWPSKKTIMEIIKKVANIIKAINPDIILLQEVQKDSITSQYIDEFKELKKLLPEKYSSYIFCHYLKTRFLPHPKVLGPNYLKLYIISKYKINAAFRYALPSQEYVDIISRLFGRFFGFKRAILEAIFPMSNGQNLHVFNTHLSVFSQGTNTIERQIDYAYKLMLNLKKNQYGILAGDFNCLACSELIRYVLPCEQKKYHMNSSPLEILFKHFVSVPTIKQLSEKQASKWFTYASPLRADRKPDRTLDFLFFTPNVQKIFGKVVQNAKEVSDHLPVQATCIL